jgi:hypothetical protein
MDLGFKGEKIARNITKVGVRICLPTGHPNLCSIFNSEKLVKFETRPCVFARLRLKGLENSSERHESWRAHLSTNGTSKSMLNFQFREVGSKLKLDRAFLQDLGLKGVKIDRNVMKVGVCICLPTGHPNLCSIFNYEK